MKDGDIPNEDGQGAEGSHGDEDGQPGIFEDGHGKPSRFDRIMI